MLGKSIQAAESALTAEKHRLKKLEELEAMNQSLKSRSNEVSIFFFYVLSVVISYHPHVMKSHVFFSYYYFVGL